MLRDVAKFWKLMAHLRQWLINLGGPDQIQVVKIEFYEIRYQFLQIRLWNQVANPGQ